LHVLARPEIAASGPDGKGIGAKEGDRLLYEEAGHKIAHCFKKGAQASLQAED